MASICPNLRKLSCSVCRFVDLFVFILRSVQGDNLIVAKGADMPTIKAEAPKADDRLAFFHVSKLMNMLWFCNGVHLGSAVFSRVNDLVKRIKPTIYFS
jgi:hypothetical protein